MTYAPKSLVASRLATGLSALSLVVLSLGSLGCASSTGTGGTGGSGATGTGGSTSGTGGSGTGTGGNATGTGGSVGTGGSGTGGVVATGGATGTGGTVSSGGASGSTGGVSGTGGTGTGGASGSSGGATGTGGGAAGTTGTGGSVVAGQCPANAIFCATFENGQLPSGATFYPAYQQSTMSTYVSVDATVGANGSAHSLKVTPGSNFSQMLGVPTTVSSFWATMYIRSDIDTSTVSGHDTFVAAIDDSAAGGTLTSAGDPNNGEAIRIGEHECQLEINRKSDDKEVLSDAVNGTSNYTCAGGVTLSKDVWYCLEIFYDGPNSAVQVYVNGTEATGLHVTGWGPYNYDLFKFGFENYGGTARTIWYDDVAITKSKIGCF